MDRRTRAPGCGSNSIIYESRRLRNTQPPVSRSGPRAHGRIRPVCRREAALALKRAAPDPRLVLFLKAGVCGGFTTFSSFALETGDLLKSGHTAAALLYAAASLVLGVAAVFAGEAAVR